MNETTPFAGAPETPRGHLTLLFYEAVYRIIHELYERAAARDRELSSVFEEFPFLAPYFRHLHDCFDDELTWDEANQWLREQILEWERAAEIWLPLRALEKDLELDRDSLLALVLVGLVEEDAQFGRLFAALQQPLAERRPTVGLVHELIDREVRADAWTLVEPLIKVGLVETINPDSPRAEWVLKVPLPLWSAARGEPASPPLPGVTHHAPESFAPASELLLPDQQIARLEELGTLLAEGRAATFVVRGSPGSERLEVTGAVARRLHRGVLELSSAAVSTLVGPLCTLARAMPVYMLDLAPGESFDLPLVSGYRGPVGIVLGEDGGVTGPGVEHAVTLHLEPDTPAHRLKRWRAAFQGQRVEDVDGIAQRFLLPARYLRRSARLAASYASLDGRTEVTEVDVREAVRLVNRQSLDVHATWLRDGARWSQLVAAPGTESDLRRLLAHCRRREHLPLALGEDFPGGLGCGVRAIFEGPSGTGKTLAARVLATDLGLDLYRVDLASVVNKYIGETEKNLGLILSRAEELDIVLLLDEGDALMGRRTEVSNANDRFANLETDYLLQRLETYRGIIFVTTNAGDNIDPAFRRRMEATVKFHLPDAGERWRLWQLHLPANHAVAEDLERVALHYSLSGGQIRNAAVQATLAALEAGEDRVDPRHLESAVRAEYRKGGEVCPSEYRQVSDDREASLAGFLGAITQ